MQIFFFNSFCMVQMTWGTTVNNMEKILSFINTYLKLTLRILWPNTISNLELWQQVEQPVEAELLRPDLDEDVMRPSGSSCGQLDNITQNLDDWYGPSVNQCLCFSKVLYMHKVSVSKWVLCF